MPYDLETPERAVKQLAGECPSAGREVQLGWSLALESLTRTLYHLDGWRGRLALWLIGRIARKEARQ